jgi:hypothetical protein
LSDLFDLWDIFVYSEHDGNAANKQNQDAKEEKSVDRDYIIVDKFWPGTHRAKPHEDRQVKQHIDSGLKRVVESFQAEPVTVLLVSNTG